MQNILDILKDLGIEIPEDKTAELNKKVAENYKTIAEHQRKLEKAEQERDGYKEQLKTAQDTLKGFEGVDLNTMNQQLADYKKKAEDAAKDYEAKIAARDFEDALKTEMEAYKFSSNAAKNAVMAQIRESNLTLGNNGKIRGLDDLIKEIKEADASAFVDENDPNQNPNPARFTGKMGASAKKTGKQILSEMSLDERIKMKRENPKYYEQLTKGE